MAGWAPISARAREACEGLDDRERLLLARAILARISNPNLSGIYRRRAFSSLGHLLEEADGQVVGHRSDGSPIGPYGAQNHPLGRDV